MGPAVELVKADEGWDSGQNGERHRRNRGVERGPGGRHPAPIGQIVDQHQGQRAERDAEPQQKRAQPGGKKAGRVDDRAENAGDGAENECAERYQIGPAPGAGVVHCEAWLMARDCRSAGGTSARVALALACKARI